MKELLADAKRRMEGAVKALEADFATVRTGRASTHLLDKVVVDAYGSEMPLNQVATVHAAEARLLTVQPFDKSLLKSIEKAIMEAQLGLTPSNDGSLIRLPVPPLTEERRKEYVKLVHKMAEDARIAVRNVRRDALQDVKRMEKDGDISKDEVSRASDDVQKITDAEVKSIDEHMHKKEAEILEV
ncbi:MAG TPA: ribosome recycling factor [Miltoncostaeales bacterium]|jgi:ribosome recycling factor|nr:ribosome recycling factor [Miltoncostaeales bacterium]